MDKYDRGMRIDKCLSFSHIIPLSAPYMTERQVAVRTFALREKIFTEFIQSKQTQFPGESIGDIGSILVARIE